MGRILVKEMSPNTNSRGKSVSIKKRVDVMTPHQISVQECFYCYAECFFNYWSDFILMGIVCLNVLAPLLLRVLWWFES
jgi:hypothetical protein